MAGHWLGLTRPDATTGALTGTQISKSHVSSAIFRWWSNHGPVGVMPCAPMVDQLGDAQPHDVLNLRTRNGEANDSGQLSSGLRDVWSVEHKVCPFV